MRQDPGPYGLARRSRQRDELALAAGSLCGAFTVEDLASKARGGRGVPGTATVYRAVRAMLETGFIEAVGERDGHALYVRCADEAHHHHLVCTSCGAVGHAPCPLDERLLADAARQGFTVTGHDVVIRGLCAACAATGAGGPTGATG